MTSIYAVRRPGDYSDRETGESRFVPVYDLDYVEADGTEVGPFSKVRSRVFVRLVEPYDPRQGSTTVRLIYESKVVRVDLNNRTAVVVPDVSGSIAVLANDGRELSVRYQRDVYPFE